MHSIYKVDTYKDFKIFYDIYLECFPDEPWEITEFYEWFHESASRGPLRNIIYLFYVDETCIGFRFVFYLDGEVICNVPYAGVAGQFRNQGYYTSFVKLTEDDLVAQGFEIVTNEVENPDMLDKDTEKYKTAVSRMHLFRDKLGYKFIMNTNYEFPENVSEDDIIYTRNTPPLNGDSDLQIPQTKYLFGFKILTPTDYIKITDDTISRSDYIKLYLSLRCIERETKDINNFMDIIPISEFYTKLQNSKFEFFKIL